MIATFALKFEIRSRTQYYPLIASAGMIFFGDYDVADFQFA